MSTSTQKRAIKLNTGASMPLLGYGTFLCAPGEVKQSVKTAVKLGYRHIDCAAGYENQKEVGEALAELFGEGVVKREELFITSKLRATDMDPPNIAKHFEETLSELGLPYIDLFLVHQPIACIKENDKPVPRRGFGMHEIWRVFETLYESGKTKAIGVSNFPTVLINDLLNYSKIKPAVNQIERTPYLTQTKHIKYCRDNGIQITAYGALGAPGLTATTAPDAKVLLKDEVVRKIADKYKKTPAQVLLRWQIQDDMVVIPKSVKEERIKENFDVWDFVLEDADVDALNGLNENLRYFNQDWMGVPTFT